MKKIVLDKGWMAVCLFLTGSSLALGQWQTQSLELKPGWNGVYMHVNSTHSGIAALASGTLVEEVWLWQPRITTAQYVTNPDLFNQSATGQGRDARVGAVHVHVDTIPTRLQLQRLRLPLAKSK
jgi:hypothetical protein